VLAPEWVAPVARRMPEVDEVIAAPFRHGALQLARRWQLARRLKSRDYRQAIVLPNSWKAALVPFLAAIPLRSGYVGESRYGLLNLLYRRANGAMREHYARLAQAPDAEPGGPLPQPRLCADAAQVAATRARFGLPERYAVLCPGAEYGPAKRWPYFAELSARLDAPAVVLGSPSDAAAAAGISGTNLVGRTTLDEAIDLIAGAQLVVSNDSGLMHVAAALGRPLVALFGSSSPERTPPQGTRSRVLWLKPECSPCYARECPLGHFRCMRELTVDTVLTELARL
jgi:heptosyltransferase-2